ncbi:MAG: thermonuclease family protein [Candidatus Bipolaricaulaceae bacterium]
MARKGVAVAIGLVLAVGMGAVALPPCPPPEVEAQVLRVIDGDTIVVKIIRVPSELSKVLLPGSEVTVRYIGVDAPEAEEPGFEEAKTLNRLLVEGRKVYLELDRTHFDEYGRLLGYVYLDGQGHFMVNLALVTSPLFRALPYDNTPRYNPCFLQADVDPGTCALCREECVTADQAAQHYGKEIWVCGTVASVARLRYNRVFLNFGRPYPHQIFTVMVHERYVAAFDEKFGPHWERRLIGQVVCVYGKVKEYQGKPEILPTDPEQLRAAALGLPCPDVCPCR